MAPSSSSSSRTSRLPRPRRTRCVSRSLCPLDGTERPDLAVQMVYRHNIAHDGSIAMALSYLQISQMVWVRLSLSMSVLPRCSLTSLDSYSRAWALRSSSSSTRSVRLTTFALFGVRRLPRYRPSSAADLSSSTFRRADSQVLGTAAREHRHDPSRHLHRVRQRLEPERRSAVRGVQRLMWAKIDGCDGHRARGVVSRDSIDMPS